MYRPSRSGFSGIVAPTLPMTTLLRIASPLLFLVAACGQSAIPSGEDMARAALPDLAPTGPDLLPAPGTCNDQLRNGQETDTDCGGPCPACGGKLEIPIQALLVSDDDGGRPCPITPAEIKTWVDQANQVWNAAGVHFGFDPAAPDCCAAIKSTLLNDMTGTGDANWAAEKKYGNEVAARYPGRAAVYFRHGPGPNPTGGAFSWFDYNFVAAVGRVSTVCGHVNSGILAHEIGHYAGLAHTFARVFASVKEAEDHFTMNNADPNVFDGDGLGDTPPDPFVSTPEVQCQPTQSLSLAQVDFPLPRGNVMSYYDAPMGLTPNQIERARWFWTARKRHGMAMPDNHDNAGMALQAETLAIDQELKESSGPQDMAGFGDGWDGDRQLFCGFKSNGELTLRVPVEKAGTYRVDLYATFAPDFGRFWIDFDTESIGLFDAYAPGVFPTGRIALGTHTLAAKNHLLHIQNNGKNPLSTNTLFGIDYISLTPVP